MTEPHVQMVTPFVLLLLAIALMPFFRLRQVPQVVLSRLLCVGVLLVLFFATDSANLPSTSTRSSSRRKARSSLKARTTSSGGF